MPAIHRIVRGTVSLSTNTGDPRRLAGIEWYAQSKLTEMVNVSASATASKLALVLVHGHLVITQAGTPIAADGVALTAGDADPARRRRRSVSLINIHIDVFGGETKGGGFAEDGKVSWWSADRVRNGTGNRHEQM